MIPAHYVHLHGQVGNTYHLFATEIAERCPLMLFMNNSQVIHAVADKPGGPYVKLATVLPPFHHNPTAVGPTADGHYLLYFIGADVPNPAATCIDCRAGVPAKCNKATNFCRAADQPTNGQIAMAWSKDVRGPWQTRLAAAPPFSRANQYLFLFDSHHTATCSPICSRFTPLIFKGV